MIKKKSKTKQNIKNNYNVWNNGKLFSLIALCVVIIFFILSIVNLPFFSVFPGYTFGALFGYYSYIFYVILIFFFINKIFNFKNLIIERISKIKIFYYSWISFSILILGIILLIESSVYINTNNVAFPGLKAWDHSFNAWWSDFTMNSNPLKPNINNSGIIIVFCTSTILSTSGSIISIVLSILLILYFVFYSFNSSPFKKIKILKKNKNEKNRQKNEHESKIINLAFENDNKIIIDGFKTKIIDLEERIPGTSDSKNKKKEKLFDSKNLYIEKDEDIGIPFVNPFEDDNYISQKKITENVFSKSKIHADEETNLIFDNQIPYENSNKKNNQLKMKNKPVTYEVTGITSINDELEDKDKKGNINFEKNDVEKNNIKNRMRKK